MVERVGDDVAKCSPPCVFGVHGEWGSGKTSFLHQLHWYLTGDCPQQTEEEREAAKKKPGEDGQYQDTVTVVWFEAWRYQHERDPVIALLHEIRTQLSLASKWIRRGEKTANVTIRGALLSMEDVTKHFGFKASKIQQAGEQWERENLAVALPSHTVRRHLNDAVDALIGKTPRSKKRRDARLVVLVDDLDRCEPEPARRLLEGIKIYLNLPSCVFVLGMDQRVVERAIAKDSLKDESPDVRQEYAREYLDKLCTNIWHLSLIDPVNALHQWLPADHPGRDQFLNVVGDHGCLAANARKIKSFANVLIRFVDILGYGTAPPLDPRLIVLMACLYHDHFELYRRIESEPDFYNRIRWWATGQRDTGHDLLKPLRLPVSFGETDATERRPTPAPVGDPTFPDPVRGNVFRLQSLVETLGEVEVSELKKYLLSGTAREQETQSEDE